VFTIIFRNPEIQFNISDAMTVCSQSVPMVWISITLVQCYTKCYNLNMDYINLIHFLIRKLKSSTL